MPVSRTYEILPSLAPTPISFLHPFVNSIFFHPFQLSLCPSSSCTDLDLILQCSLFNLPTHPPPSFSPPLSSLPYAPCLFSWHLQVASGLSGAHDLEEGVEENSSFRMGLYQYEGVRGCVWGWAGRVRGLERKHPVSNLASSQCRGKKG